jgi:hypothetical protein
VTQPDIWYQCGNNRRMEYRFIDGEWYWRLLEDGVLLAEGHGEP